MVDDAGAANLGPLADPIGSGSPTPVSIEGVTLEQYATMRAGLADGLTLEEMLAFEALEPRQWSLAEREFRDCLLTDDLTAGLTMSLEVDRLAAAARRHWERPIPPLDEDLRSWLDFVRCWSEAADPAGFLAERELRPTDLTNLHRLWATRLEATPPLRDEAVAILAAPPGPLVSVKPERVRIVTKRAGRRTDDDVDRTRLPLGPGALATLPFEAQAPAAPMWPSLRVPIPPKPRPERPGTTGVDETSFLKGTPDNVTLPFWEVAVPQPAAPALAAEAAFVAPSLPQDDDPLERLTFFSTRTGQPVVTTLGGAAPPDPVARAAGDAVATEETLFLRVTPDAAPLPFGPPPRRQRTAGNPDATAPPGAPSKPAMPFASNAAGDALQRAKLHALVTQGPGSKVLDAGDETAVPAVKSDDPTLPFATALREGDAAGETAIGGIPTLGSGLPFSEPTAGPTLTLEQYASLCVDIELAPLSRQETVERYGLGAEGWRAEDAAWKKRIASDLELRTTFERARAAYRKWRGA